MTSTPDATNGEDLAALRAEIDELQDIPEDELVSPPLASLNEHEPERELEAEPTDAMGTEKWDRPVSEESLDQE